MENWWSTGFWLMYSGRSSGWRYHLVYIFFSELSIVQCIWYATVYLVLYSVFGPKRGFFTKLYIKTVINSKWASYSFCNSFRHELVFGNNLYLIFKLYLVFKSLGFPSAMIFVLWHKIILLLSSSVRNTLATLTVYLK